MPRCPQCRVNFPIGLELCPNDGETLIVDAGRGSGPETGTEVATEAGAGVQASPMDPTEPIEIGSLASGRYVETGATASLVAAGAGSSADDLTRAARPGARQRRPEVSTGNRAQDSRSKRKSTEDQRSNERIGQVLGNYKLLRVLGRGGMGWVYQAEHVKLGRLVALKLLRDDHAQRRDAVGRFFQEARAVNRVRHRNIVDVTDFVELERDITFLVMEFLEGSSLGRLLHDEELSAPRALALLIQICDGLGAAHQVGVVHRDLKPDNIFVVPTGDGAELIKLLDFGVAKLMWREEDDNYGFETAAGAVVGTPTYMSPEQAGGMAVDTRADIYSLGAIMYEMFTGRPLFRARSFGEFVRKHLNEPPTPPSHTEGGRHIDPRLEATILRCLEKAPGARFQDVDELKDELMLLLGAVETSLPPSIASKRPGADNRVAATGATGATGAAGAASAADAADTASAASAAGAADLLAFTPASSAQDSQRVVPDTAMSMGDLPAKRTGVRSPGRTLLWLAVGVLAVVGTALAFIAVTNSTSDGPSASSVSSTRGGEALSPGPAPVAPVVTPIDPVDAATDPTPVATNFNVRFLSTPRARVIEITTGEPICRTPCDVTVDPNRPGRDDYRDYELQLAGYQAHPVRIDLAAGPRTVDAALQELPAQASKTTANAKAKANAKARAKASKKKRARRKARRKRARASKRRARASETPIADKGDSPVVQPKKVEPKRRPRGPIDPTETLDSFDNP